MSTFEKVGNFLSSFTEKATAVLFHIVVWFFGVKVLQSFFNYFSDVLSNLFK